MNTYKRSLKMFLDNLFTSCNIVVGAVYLNKSKGNVLSLCFCASIFLFISIILFHIINLIIHDCKIDDFFDVDKYENPQNPQNSQKSNDYCNSKEEFKNFYDDFDKFKNISIYFYLIFSFFKEIINWYIIYFFSPNHFAAISSIEIFFINLISIKNGFKGLPIYLVSSISFSKSYIIYYNSIKF